MSVLSRFTQPRYPPILTRRWTRFWMRYAGLGPLGRAATRLAVLFAPPHKARYALARMNPAGFFAPSVTIHHADLLLGRHLFLDERVVLFQREHGGRMQLDDRVCIYRDCILETGYGGQLFVGPGTSMHPRCQINAYLVEIRIGAGVMMAPNCALYCYDHGVTAGRPISEQPLSSNGPISIGDGAWLGVGAIVLGGVRIGQGAVIGAGAVVTCDVPDNAIAVGVPARVVRLRQSADLLPSSGDGWPLPLEQPLADRGKGDSR